MEALSLIDVSAEDDLLLDLASPPPPPPHPDPPRAGTGSLVGAEASDSEHPGGSPAAAGRAVDPDGVMEEQAAPERTESPKQRKAKTGVNLRKSLAWDSAFFTSEGVLDTEELAIVNSTFRKTQGSRLPGIAEEMRRSGESTTSTLESESWAMENLETELFDNVRASIQRTLGKFDKAPGVTAGSSKPSKATTNATRIAARKVVDRMPQTKIKAPVSTSQGVVGGKQRPQVTPKEPTAGRAALSGGAEAKPSSRPPRALPRVATMRSSTNTTVTSEITGKRSSTGGVVTRQAVGKPANTTASVRPGGVMKSSSISKSGAFTSAATSPFQGVSVDTKQDAKIKSATVSNKNRTAQRVPVRSSSRSDSSKTKPSRSSGNKIPARVPGDRPSPSISPSSSIDSMSSVISGASTASTVGKMSHTSESFNTQSSLSPSLRKSNDCPPTTKHRSPIVIEGQYSETAPFVDNSKATADTTNKGKSSKPSGLRRPTPKIGYFDAEKSIGQNIGVQMQIQPLKIQSPLPATPKSQPSSTETIYTTICQQESRSNAAPQEESGASRSKMVKAAPLKIALMEAEPFKVAEPEMCTQQTTPVVAEPDSEKPIDQNIGAQVQLQPMEIQCSLPATPNCQSPSNQTMNTASSFGQQESKPTAAPQEEVPLKVVQMELAPLKVADHDVCTHQSGPMVAADTAKENIPALHQNIQANVDASSLAVELLTQKLSSISLGEGAPNLAS
ncbi:hypothetical protein ACP70R_005747 [Stipagrostis hirtigluma subsp. patula]